ncbi:MAG TPA: transposase [Rubricoccaceae bacterium]|jgi:transposase
MTTRRSFSSEYKLEAVRAAERSGSVAQTARDLAIRPGLIHRWKRELRDDGRRAFPGNGSPRDEELVQLRRENKRLHDELSIIKKALGIVSSPSR